VPSGRRLLAALGLWLLASVVIGGATFVMFGEQTPIEVVVAEVYALLIASLLIVFRRSLGESLGLRRCTAGDVTLAAGVVIGAYSLVGSIQRLFAPASWSSLMDILLGIGADGGRLATASPLMIAVIVLRATLLAAVGEELLFRGALHGWLRRRLPAGATIPITAAAWALIHGFPLIWPLAFVMGIGFGWIRERSGSTVPTITVHALHNAALIAISYATTSWTATLPAWGG